jgi:arylsulfatase B
MQHFVIPSDEPWGLGLNEKLMPEYFKEAGYQTDLVGKWHLGFHKKSHTPTMRGFDSHFGYLGPYIGYYNHSLIMFDRSYARGHDFRDNLEIFKSGTYVTELFTNRAVDIIRNHREEKPLFLMVSHLAPHAGNEDDPVEAPESVVNKFNYIKSEKRRKLAGMISVLDDGVGRVITALKEKNILNNTIVVFLSGKH